MRLANETPLSGSSASPRADECLIGGYNGHTLLHGITVFEGSLIPFGNNDLTILYHNVLLAEDSDYPSVLPAGLA